MEEEKTVIFFKELESQSLKKMLLSELKEIDSKYSINLNEDQLVNMALFSLLETFKDYHFSKTDNLSSMKNFLIESTVDFYKEVVEVESD